MKTLKLAFIAAFGLMAGAVHADVLSDIRATEYSGFVFQAGEQIITVGRVYRMNELIKSGLEMLPGDVTIAIPPCDMTYFAKRGAVETTLNIRKEQDIWGASAPQGLSESDLYDSYVRFDGMDCAGLPFLYAHGAWGKDVMRITLTTADDSAVSPAIFDAKTKCGVLPASVTAFNMADANKKMTECKQAVAALPTESGMLDAKAKCGRFPATITAINMNNVAKMMQECRAAVAGL